MGGRGAAAQHLARNGPRHVGASQDDGRALSCLRPRPDESPFPFFWKLLDERGKRCVVIDAFLTCPLQSLGGVQIVDWGSWSWFWEPTMIPASLKSEIRRRFGPYPAEDH